MIIEQSERTKGIMQTLDTGAPALDGPKISIEIRPGRWGKIFHLFDLDGREIALHQKEALKMARQILKESKK